MKLSAEMINHCLLVGLRRGMTEAEIISDVDTLEGILSRHSASVVAGHPTWELTYCACGNVITPPNLGGRTRCTSCNKKAREKRWREKNPERAKARARRQYERAREKKIIAAT